MLRLLLLAAIACGSACSSFGPAGAAAFDCAEPVVGRLATALAGEAAGALKGEHWDNGALLDSMVAAAGPALVCAVQRIAAAASGDSKKGGAGPEQLLVAERAQDWLHSRRHRVQYRP